MRKPACWTYLAKVDNVAYREKERNQAVRVGLHNNNDVCGAALRAENVVAPIAG
jgi:hypothetical protein